MDGRRLATALLFLGLGVLPAAPAQTPAPIVPAEVVPPPETVVLEAAPAAVPPAENPYAGDLFTRSKLTGDWGGARSALAGQAC